MRYQKICKHCEKVFSTRLSAKIYCSEFCKSRNSLSRTSIREKSIASGGLKLGKVGDISELEVSTYYMREGWEVFRNVSSNGPADIVIWKPNTGEVKFIDVKSCGEEINESRFKTYISKSHEKVNVVMYQYTNKVLKEEEDLNT